MNGMNRPLVKQPRRLVSQVDFKIFYTYFFLSIFTRLHEIIFDKPPPVHPLRLLIDAKNF